MADGDDGAGAVAAGLALVKTLGAMGRDDIHDQLRVSPAKRESFFVGLRAASAAGTTDDDRLRTVSNERILYLYRFLRRALTAARERSPLSVAVYEASADFAASIGELDEVRAVLTSLVFDQYPVVYPGGREGERDGLGGGDGGGEGGDEGGDEGGGRDTNDDAGNASGDGSRMDEMTAGLMLLFSCVSWDPAEMCRALQVASALGVVDGVAVTYARAVATALDEAHYVRFHRLANDPPTALIGVLVGACADFVRRKAIKTAAKAYMSVGLEYLARVANLDGELADAVMAAVVDAVPHATLDPSTATVRLRAPRGGKS